MGGVQRFRLQVVLDPVVDFLEERHFLFERLT